MVVDIRLLQGKIIGDLDQNPKNFSRLMEELALELIVDSKENTEHSEDRSME